MPLEMPENSWLQLKTSEVSVEKEKKIIYQSE